MGTIIQAECKQCQLSKKLFLGGGMMDFKTNSPFPFACHNCDSLVKINLFDEHYYCPKCQSENVTSYEHPFLKPKDNTGLVYSCISNRSYLKSYSLSAGANQCAECLNYTLFFERVGLYD